MDKNSTPNSRRLRDFWVEVHSVYVLDDYQVPPVPDHPWIRDPNTDKLIDVNSGSVLSLILADQLYTWYKQIVSDFGSIHDNYDRSGGHDFNLLDPHCIDEFQNKFAQTLPYVPS